MPSSSASPSSFAIMNSVVPLGESGARRITSREIPEAPQGTKESSPTAAPSAVCAVTSRQRASAGSPRRLSAMEKPRSVSPWRQESVCSMTARSSSSLRSPWRRTRSVIPARSRRATVWRISVMEVLFREKRSGWMIASSPRGITDMPVRTYAGAPALEALITAGIHP